MDCVSKSLRAPGLFHCNSEVCCYQSYTDDQIRDGVIENTFHQKACRHALLETNFSSKYFIVKIRIVPENSRNSSSAERKLQNFCN